MEKSVRRGVTEVTCDLSPSMMRIAGEVFPNAKVVNDRFHEQLVYNEAVNEIRMDVRRRLMKLEGALGKNAPVKTYSNGETIRQILARSRRTLMVSSNKWTDVQRHRVNILFRHHPILRQAYDLSMELRSIFNSHITKSDA